jgi:hypothetical protein
MGSPSIPNPWTITLNSNINGDLDVGLDDIQITQLPLINLQSSLTSDSKVTSDSTITSNSKLDMGLDDIRIKQLPRIELEFSIKPMRVHLPTHYKFCLTLFGSEVFEFAFCGESMVIIEPYIPHKTECCD